MASGSNNLPPGFWAYFNGLPPGTTSEDISAWICAQGVEIPPHRVECRERRDGRVSAVVSFPDSQIVALIKWALTDGASQPNFNGYLFEINKPDTRA
jgi:hypothetical protein